MSFFVATPEAFALASQDLTSIGSAISEARATAAASTTTVVAAAEDEVSTAIATLFGSHAQQFQALSAQAAAFYDQFVQALTGGAASYVEAEAANVPGLLLGSHAGASAAAALSNAAESGTPFDLVSRLLGGLVERAVEEGARAGGAALDELISRNSGAGLGAQIRRIATSGVQLFAKNGVQVFTDGQQFVISGTKTIDNLYAPQHFLPIIEDAQNYARKYVDLSSLNPEAVRSLLGSELHVVARGEGLAQSYFQRTGNEIYKIDTNAQGEFIQEIKTPEAIYNQWVAMTANGPLPMAKISPLQLAQQAENDAKEIIRQAQRFF